MKLGSLLTILTCPLLVLGVSADDLMTKDGRLYSNYKVILHDSYSVTITYSEGATKIPISQLPPELQQKYAPPPAASGPAMAASQPPGEDAVTNPAAHNTPNPNPIPLIQQVPAAPMSLSVNVVQVTQDGALCQMRDGTGLLLFITGTSNTYPAGQPAAIRAVRAGNYSYTDTTGMSRVVEKWTAISDSSPTQVAGVNGADDSAWTVKGVTYRNVTVLGHDEYRVNIIGNGQEVTLYLSDLPPALQKRFDYNPRRAAVAQRKDEANHHNRDEISGF